MDTALFDQLRTLPPHQAGTLPPIPRDIGYLIGCRSFKQFCSTFRTIAEPEHFCVFCKLRLAKNQPIERTDRWYLKVSDFPVKGTRLALLIIPNRHLAPPYDWLLPSDGAEIIELHNRARMRFNLPGGGLVSRFGDPFYHVGTVPHFHVNVLVPTVSEECTAPLGKTTEDRSENYKRLLEFRSELEKAGGLPWLFSPEGIEFSKS